MCSFFHKLQSMLIYTAQKFKHIITLMGVCITLTFLSCDIYTEEESQE